MTRLNWLKKPPSLTLFSESPAVGLPECVCSICEQVIQKEEMPLRIWPIGGELEVRLCEKCQEEYLGIEH